MSTDLKTASQPLADAMHANDVREAASVNLPLYQLAKLRDLLDDRLAETEGELTPELAAELDALDVASSEKIERVALYIREQIGTAKAIKDEEDRLSARRKAKEHAAESLKAYLHACMTQLGKTKADGLLCTVALQKNPPSVAGEPASPEEWNALRVACPEFVRVVPEQVTVDRRALLEAHKAGNELPPMFRIEQSMSVRIR